MVNASVNVLGNSLELLRNFGFFQVVLPLIIIFAILYGILEKTQIFGDSGDQKTASINALISFSVAFFVVASTDTVEMINNVIPNIALMMVIAVFAVMLLSFFSMKPGDVFESNKAFTKVAVVIIIFVFLAVVDASGTTIPVVHQANDAMIGDFGTDDSGDSVSSGGYTSDSAGDEGGSRSMGVDRYISPEMQDALIVMGIMFILPLVVVMTIIKKSGS